MDVVGLPYYYAVYECSYADRNRIRACHIINDDDQNVASLKFSPRQRLFEAIEQECNYEHFDYRIKSFNVDFMAFRDLLVSKAILRALAMICYCGCKRMQK